MNSILEENKINLLQQKIKMYRLAYPEAISPMQFLSIKFSVEQLLSLLDEANGRMIVFEPLENGDFNYHYE